MSCAVRNHKSNIPIQNPHQGLSGEMHIQDPPTTQQGRRVAGWEAGVGHTYVFNILDR